MVSIARLSMVKQSSFGLPPQYGHRVTKVNTADSSAHGKATPAATPHAYWLERLLDALTRD